MGNKNLPTGFQPIFHSFCNNCTDFEGHFESDHVFGNGRVIIVNNVITCANYDRCKSIAKHLEVKKKE